MAGINDTDPYIEVDMKEPMKYSQVYIQGRQDATEWVTSFKIFYDSSNSTLMEYYNGTGENVSTCADPEGGTGGLDPPPPWKIIKM